MSIVVKLEQVCLTVDLYKDYKLELETKEKELTGNKDDDVITIYDEGYRKRVTETDGNVTRITTKANLEDKLTPAKRLHFFMKFVGRKMAAMTTRAKEASQWGVQPFENKKKFVNLTKDNYKKSYSDELIHFCAQVDEDDYGRGGLGLCVRREKSQDLMREVGAPPCSGAKLHLGGTSAIPIH